MFTRKGRPAGGHESAHLMPPPPDARPVSPASIDYYVAGLRRAGPLPGMKPKPETPWKAIALVSLFVSMVALIAAAVAVVVAAKL